MQNPHVVKERIAELEAQVKKLKEANSALRKQLASNGAKVSKKKVSKKKTTTKKVSAAE